MDRRTKDTNTALSAYCTALGWDATRLRSAFHSTGLPHNGLYLIDPVQPVLDRIDEFLGTEFGLMVITGPNGLGKTALRDFVLQGLAEEKGYWATSINNPGLFSPGQMGVTIFQNLFPAMTIPKTQGAVFTALSRAMVASKESGISTVVWVDEGQRLKIGHVEFVRSLSDIKTPNGESVCKVIISGTDGLKKHVEGWLVSDCEEASAFCDRWGTFAIELRPWEVTHTRQWTTKLAQFAANSDRVVDPFEPTAIAAICTNTEGRPRPIVQMVRAAILLQSEKHWVDNTQLRITVDIIKELFP